MHHSTHRGARRHGIRSAVLATAGVGVLALSACSGGASSPTSGDATQSGSGTSRGAAAAGDTDGGDRFAFTYDGGIRVIDADDLSEVADLPLEGFNRLNSFGDGEHVLVSTEGGFQVLSTGAGGGSAGLTDLVFPATTPGHVVRHAGHTVLFDDGTGDITLLDTSALGSSADDTVATLPEGTVIHSEAAHHGVAVELEDGNLVRTLGDSESRSGALLQDASGTEISRIETCPSVHGEGVAAGEAVVLGCEDGVILLRNGAWEKIPSPAGDYGRVGNTYVAEGSPIAVVDHRTDPDAEGVVLDQIGFVDTEAATFDVIDMPEGVQYTWRGVGRDAEGNAWVLGTDGSLHHVDVTTKALTDSIPVVAAWEGPEPWQQAHPALVVDGDTAWVTEPATQTVHKVDLSDGTVTSVEVGVAPNEVALVRAS
ncbi:NHL repeat-containing protein [Actinomyces provencensis]|uniref:hypothetical protein n=1 Tax=Actinomyces provencensis TaxID=1720198 RepID=UPI00096A743C|nr:hypothetical protein [Actinomyces provencensis]